MDLMTELKEIVGPERVSDSDAICQSYSYSCFLGMNWVRKPDVVVIAETPEQVSRILKLANHDKIPVTPRGAAGQGGHPGARQSQAIESLVLDKPTGLCHDSNMEGGINQASSLKGFMAHQLSLLRFSIYLDNIKISKVSPISQ